MLDDAYEVMGCHLEHGGAVFRVWAPNADTVEVMTEANEWNRVGLAGPDSGIWEGRVAGVEQGTKYKFTVTGGGHAVEKADPFGFFAEPAPGNASIAWDLAYTWGDDEWMGRRGERLAVAAPVSIYELHLGSWLKEGVAGYRDVADGLIAHLQTLGFSHVEFLPLMEHPFYGSWGYLTTGYFAPTSRYGTPQDLMYLVDRLHRAGIGVILDWVPAHFPTDSHGLGMFDGTHLFEYADPRQGFHQDWHSYIFNYDQNEVRSFLRSSAHYWVSRYHIDALRVDAVSSMLYLDYSRKDGEWIPNVDGGNENLGAIEFLRDLNRSVRERHPGVQTIAEESTAWVGVTRDPSDDGLGFSYKWDMGWMNDTLRHLARDPTRRADNQGELTFRASYASSEDYVLPLSHDEVVHGKGSLLAKLPGDRWQQLANLRLLLGLQWMSPGKKLLFMGGELGTPAEWDHEDSVPWHLLGDPGHAGIHRWVADLNATYQREPALHRGDCHPEGLEWIVPNDAAHGVLVFRRNDPSGSGRCVLVAINPTSVVWSDYRVGVPHGGVWDELLSSDSRAYGGTDIGNLGRVETDPLASHGEGRSLSLTLPPLGLVVLAPRRGKE